MLEKAKKGFLSKGTWLKKVMSAFRFLSLFDAFATFHA